MRYHIAVIHKDPDSDYGISFSCLICFSAGEGFEEVIRMGREALSICVKDIKEAGEDAAKPTPVAAILAEPLFTDGEPVLIGVECEDTAPGDARRAA